MHPTSKLVRVAGLIAASIVIVACQPGASATTAPVATTPAATTVPATAATGTAAPGSPGLPAGAFAEFTPTAGATPQLQGGATLVELEGKTQVVIGLLPLGSETYAAAIQAGTCGSLTPEIAYRLTDVVSGASLTALDVDLETLLATDYAVNIIVAGSETESSLACGNIEPTPVP